MKKVFKFSALKHNSNSVCFMVFVPQQLKQAHLKVISVIARCSSFCLKLLIIYKKKCDMCFICVSILMKQAIGESNVLFLYKLLLR